MQLIGSLLLTLGLTQAFVPTLPRTTRVVCYSESSAVPAEPESDAAPAAPPVEAPAAPPPAETEDETLMTSLEAALVAEEASWHGTWEGLVKSLLVKSS